VGPRVGLNASEKSQNLLPHPGIEPRFLGRPAHSLVTIPSTLSRFRIIAINSDNFFFIST